MPIRIDFADPHGGAALRCAFDPPQHTLVAHTVAQVRPLLDAVAAWAQQGRWCVGYLRYEAASAFDAALQTHTADGPLAWFGVFDQARPWPDAATTDDDPGALSWHDPLSQPQFATNMAAIHQAIAAGELYQVNYTTMLQAGFSGSTAALFARLQRAQPGGYAACIDSGFEQVLSVSPELFFDWKDGTILTRPMKGTAARGHSAEEDTARAAALTQSPKERAENVMIVDLLRNDLSRIAEPHSVKVPALFAVQTLPTVHQMVSDVRARTRPGTTLADVFAALFPCGSITGAPKVRAMQLIKSLEPQPRGVYCGAIGVVRPGGHATFSVAIRTVTRQGQLLRCGIGSGITADASADAEWQEWQHKRRFLERASQRFTLLETLRLQGGEFHLLDWHLARLQAAARHFGYPFDLRQVDAALRALVPPTPDERVWRVRLQLDASGTPSAEKFEQNSTPARVKIALAATPFEAFESEFTRFKTSRRAHYEAFAPTDPALFDTLLYNPRGELTECTRGNIAVLLDGQWCTPALHCGLLAGVGRAHHLAEGRLREAVITLADLPRVQAWAFINSLRGWVDAELV
ncbi:aminodeoxychorismate synthase component I [Rhodoferax sp.]|uniref:aminodeoxychorismate synthase component I n=1 Tax=Rhodoferax sp. TaxID=50421 RepID=UPI002635BFB1|nr:aminodeoxychorismate synthase component I [Rhodoferax sp.]MDD2924464.1 aminodeoxychorismate synthase component I [Rhodoferax sp.]